jgi:hypothetical protein
MAILVGDKRRHVQGGLCRAPGGEAPGRGGRVRVWRDAHAAPSTPGARASLPTLSAEREQMRRLNSRLR